VMEDSNVSIKIVLPSEISHSLSLKSFFNVYTSDVHSSRDRRRHSRSASRDKKSRRDRDHSSGSDGVGGYKPRKKLPEAPPQVASKAELKI
jgi:hypothetical protein